MKTEKELNADILRVTMKIQQQFPELVKYLNETPVEASVSDNKVDNLKHLQAYYESLDDLLKKYDKNHVSE